MTDDNVDPDAADSSTDSEYGFGPAVADTAAPARAPRIQAKRGGRGSLRRKLTSVAILVGALAAVGGGYALLAPSSGAADTAVSATDVEKGRPSRSRGQDRPLASTPLRTRRVPSAGINTVHTP